MLPIWRALPPLAFFAALGSVLDRVLWLDLGRGAGRWVRWVACGIVATFGAALHPGVLAALIALGVAGRVAKARDAAVAPPPEPRAPWTSSAWWRAEWKRSGFWAIAAVALSLVVVCRPPALAYWDSFVWLAKARIESSGWGALRQAALDRSADVIPSGYPLLWPLSASWLSMGARTMDALAAGAAAMTLATLLLFLDAAHDAFDDGAIQRARWAPLVLGLLGFTPLVFVHLRAAYVDLPVGLLAATCTLRLARGFERGGGRSPDVAVAAIAAAALAGMKDEGMAHVAALGVAAIDVKARGGNRIPLAPGLAILAAAAIPFNGWRWILRAHGVADTDHTLSAPDVHAFGELARATLAHMADTRSWGALWPIAFACAALVMARAKAFQPVTRFATLAFLAEAALLAAALVFGPARVRVFAFEGTLLNRLLLQLAPPAGAMLALTISDAARAWRAVRRATPGKGPSASTS
jgi:hypothetical protein